MTMHGDLFQGHPQLKTIQKFVNSKKLGEIVANFVSAKGLTSFEIPTLLQMHSLNSNDNTIWKKAYDEEYYGLKDLPSFKIIDHDTYVKNKQKFGRLLPTMAISTLKSDSDGNPVRVKWRIVALGNLDTYLWSKADTYAPVLSQKELRILTALAIDDNCYLKCGDVKQAFVQASLPANENYVLKPPPGCPNTKPNTYWHLIRAIYGLRRAPKHWFLKATQILKDIGLQPLPNSPCIFEGVLIKNHPPITLGLYVDDFVYWSTDPQVEKEFEQRLQNHIKVDFMGRVTHFLGLKFTWTNTNNNWNVHLSQTAFIENLAALADLSTDTMYNKNIPFRPGFQIDSIPKQTMDITQRQKLQLKLQQLVGSFIWLSQNTRPDIATVVSLLSQHIKEPSQGHINAAKTIVKYLLSTKEYGISFTKTKTQTPTSYQHFPTIHSMCDANWGPQDQKQPSQFHIQELDLFKTRSLSGYITFLHGPISWRSSRQKITARSSSEAEIYATDECVRDVIHIRNILHDLNIGHKFLQSPVQIYNDNMGCVLWNKQTTTKSIRHIQIRENASREAVAKKWVSIQHIDGNLNLADILTKEHKDTQHFLKIRNKIVTTQPKPITNVSPKIC